MLRRIVGTAQHYAWGDAVSIPHLFGLPAESGTWAEMWFGTHHMGPSRLDGPDGPALADVAGEMEMLVKILAAGQPLSLQTHPTRAQAEAGFAREDAAGVPVDAPERMYRDRSDKPEVLIALTEFEALCGFQDHATIDATLASLGWQTERRVHASRGLAGYLRWCFEQDSPPPLFSAPRWLLDVASLHPHDQGLRVAPLLHHVVLAPGQALCLPAGNLHAYLKGCGLEVMNSSDNVVRAGFTTKHVDPEELLSILDTSTLDDPVVEPGADGTYRSPSDYFSIARIDAAPTVDFAPDTAHRVVFGPFTTIEATVETTAKPRMLFLAAGDTGHMACPDGGHIWVCRQG